MRPHIWRLALLGALGLSFSVAHADTILTFAVTGDFSPSQASVMGTLNGTVTIDTTTGVMQSIDLGFTNESNFAGQVTPFTVSAFTFGGLTEFGESWLAVVPGGPHFLENLYLPTDNLVGYTGGSLCSVGFACADLSTGAFGISSGPLLDGQLTLTPEPSSLFLLGTGAASLLFFFRRYRPLSAQG